MSFNAVDYYRANSKKLITKTTRANIYLASFLWYAPGLNYPSQAVIKEIFSFTQSQLKEAEIQMAAWNIHPNIIKIYFWEPTDNLTLSIYLEYCENGLDEELLLRNQKCDWFTGELLLKHFKNLTHILKSLHANNIAHRDLKPHNIRYDEFGNLKIADFGESKIITGEEESKYHTLVGTVPYFSPEAQYKLKEKEARIPTSPLKDDVYQMGRTFFDMLVCRLDPYDNQLTQVERLNTMVEVCNKRNYPRSFIDIILKMTEPNFRNRISAETAYNLLANVSMQNESIPFETNDELALVNAEEDFYSTDSEEGSIPVKITDSEEGQTEPAYESFPNDYKAHKVDANIKAHETISKTEEENRPSFDSTPKFDKTLYLENEYESITFHPSELFIKQEPINKNSISTAASNEIESLKEENPRPASLEFPYSPRSGNPHANSANFEGWNKYNSNVILGIDSKVENSALRKWSNSYTQEPNAQNYIRPKIIANEEKLSYDQAKIPNNKVSWNGCDICKLETKTETIITTPCGHNYHHLCFNEKIGYLIQQSDKLSDIRCQLCHCSLTYKFLERNITEIFYPDITKRICLLNFSEVSSDCPFCKAITGKKLINKELKSEKVRCPKCKGNFCSFCSYTGGHKKCKELLKVLESKSLSQH